VRSLSVDIPHANHLRTWLELDDAMQPPKTVRAVYNPQYLRPCPLRSHDSLCCVDGHPGLRGILEILGEETDE
jgi:hypothetical protein